MSGKRTRRSSSDGIRLTKVGLWFSSLLVIVAVAATNTGNNGLYLVLAVMGGAILVSHFLGRANVRGLAVDLQAPQDFYANQPSRLAFELTNRGRWLPRWLLMLDIEPADLDPPAELERRRTTAHLLAYLAPGEKQSGALEIMLKRRGRRRVRFAHVSSLFPFGLFRKGFRQPSDLELLVYPEIFPSAASLPVETGKSGETASRRTGWGHELLSLRAFRDGDDPRSMHWKHTARTGELIVKEMEREENRRLSIVFDNAVGHLETAMARQRFERLVSEAATAAVHYLERGFEVELITRDERLAFAGGKGQRLRILEHLALIAASSASSGELQPSLAQANHLLLAMEKVTTSASAPTSGRQEVA